jgi:hypothetical protein
MKTTIFLGFILLLINESLNGQINKFDYIDSPIRPSRVMPDVILHKEYDISTTKNLDRFRFHDYLSIKPDTLKLYSDLSAVEEFPGSSRFYRKWTNLSTSIYEKSFIIKPDTTVKYFLIIKDPTLHLYPK